MPVWLEESLKWIADILGWNEVWEFWDSLKDTRWGKAVKTFIYGSFAAVVAYVTAHPIFVYSVGTFVLGWVLARLISWLALRHNRPLRLVRVFLSTSDRKFRTMARRFDATGE